MRATLFIILLLAVAPALAQKSPAMGTVTREELEMKRYSLDTSAAAVYLIDHGDLRVEPTFAMGTTLTRYFRIKILKKKGLAYANFKIVAVHGSLSRLKGTTWSLEGGVQKTDLGSKMVFSKKADRTNDEITVVFPNVHVGSVLECSYTISRQKLFLLGWTFQYEIPVLLSEYRMISPVWGQQAHLRGVLPLSRDESRGQNTRRFWQMKDIPAFREEPMMPNSSGYHSRILFTRANDRWEEVYRQLRRDNLPSAGVRGTELSDTVNILTQHIPDSLEKIKAISRWIKNNIRWNGVVACTAVEPRIILRQRSGTSGDINHLMITMARAAGFKAEPVLLSTRDNGFIIEDAPSPDVFNDAVCQVTTGGREILLDATEKLLGFDWLPPRCLNHKGFLTGTTYYGWIPIEANATTMTSFDAALQVSEDGLLTGKVRIMENGYHAFAVRKLRENPDAEDSLNNTLMPGKSVLPRSLGWTDDGPETPLEGNYEGPLEGSTVRINNHLLINPFFFLRDMDNPFTATVRSFPVDFVFPSERRIVYTLRVPDNYRIAELPRDRIFALAGETARCSMVITEAAGDVRVAIRVKLNKAFFEPEEYPNLREFFRRLAEKRTENIVLIRK